MARACSKSSTKPSEAVACIETACRGRVTEIKSVQSAGIRDLLPSGRIRMRYSRPRRCIVRRNSSDLPSNGWRERMTVTRSGRS